MKIYIIFFILTSETLISFASLGMIILNKIYS